MADNAATQEAASAAAAQGSANQAPAAKLSMLSLLVPMLVAVLLGGGVMVGAAWYLIRSGHLPTVQGATAKAAPEKVEEKFRLIPMEPMLVNLADPDGRSYLRLSVTLRVLETPPVKGEKPKEEKPEKGKAPVEDQAALRDAALNVLGKQTSATLLSENGKEGLKQQLRAAFADHVEEPKVKDVLFTEFLVQR